MIRADAKEIPRIFQLLYAGEGEARRPDEQQLDISTLRGVSADERPGTKIFKGKLSSLRAVLVEKILTHLLIRYRSRISTN